MANLALEDAELCQRIDEAIRSHGDVSAAMIFRRFGLERWGLLLGTFRKYVRDLRRHAAGERLATTPRLDSIVKARPMETLLRTLSLMNERLEAGDTKALPGLAAAVRAVNDCLRFSLDQEADRRADEKHAAWRDEVQTKLDRAKAEADAKAERLLQSAGVDGRVVDAVQNLYGIRMTEEEDGDGETKSKGAETPKDEG